MDKQHSSQLLQEDNIPDLMNILIRVAAKCFTLGLQLGVESWQIENIQKNHPKCEDQLREIITLRLKQEEPLTLNDIAKALSSESVHEHKLAQNIEFLYLTSEPLLQTSLAHTETCSASPSQLASQQHLQPLIHHPCAVPHTPIGNPQSQRIATSDYPLLSSSTVSQHPMPRYPLHGLPYNTFDIQGLHSLNLPQQQLVPQPITPQNTYPQISSNHSGPPPPQIANSVMSKPAIPDNGPPATKRPRVMPLMVPQPYSLLPSELLLNKFHQLIDYVKTIYRQGEVERDTLSLKWPPTPSKVYINLVCIDRSNVEKSNEYDEVTRIMVQTGSLDVVHGKKWPIDFGKIATGVPDVGQKRVVLVEGAPGVGKSTFAWEYCRRWERGEIAQQYQLVLLLRLRDERMSNAKTLSDLIAYTYVAQDICGAVSAYLAEKTYGSKMLIILEGFDELPDHCRTSESVFIRLICGELLPLATVMVTSRPWAAGICLDKYNHRIFQRTEILGFNTQQISEYVNSILSENEAKDLDSYIRNHPQIKGCMYIPLNSAIVVRVYQETQCTGSPMPKTLTELYTALAQTLLVRYLRGHPELDCKQTIGIFKDVRVSHEVERNFNDLCKIAYSGILGKSDQIQLIFRDSDLPTDFNNLGFMDSVTELYVTCGRVSSHNFLHLTFQEFLAAVHISTMPPAEQLQHFEKHEDGRMEVVLIFVAGITKLNCFTSKKYHEIKVPQFDCLNFTVLTDICHINWMFETQSEDVIALLNIKRYFTYHLQCLGRNAELPLAIEFRGNDTILPMDFYSLGYCIAHSQHQWVLDLTQIETLDEEDAEMLVAGTSFTQGKCGGVVGIKFTPCTDMQSIGRIFDGLKDLLHIEELSMPLIVPCSEIPWPELSSLRLLTIRITKTTNLELGTLLSSLTLQGLCVGSLDGNPELLYEDCVAIESYIRTTTTLTTLSLIKPFSMNEVNMELIAIALTSNQGSLETLVLEGCSITDTAAQHLAQFIAKPYKVIKRIYLKFCDLRVAGLRLLLESLEGSTVHHEFKYLTVFENGNNLEDLIKEYPDIENCIVD